MNSNVKLRQLILAVGDVFTLYAALMLTLLVKYKEPFASPVLTSHIEPFTYIFVIWAAIFYIAGLYEIKYLKNNFYFIKKLGSAILVNAAIAIVVFYFLPLGIAPKTNLFILLAIFAILESLWRYFYNLVVKISIPLTNILTIGSGQLMKNVEDIIRQNPQLGYKIKLTISENLNEKEIEHINQIVISEKINLIVIPSHIKKNSKAAHAIYRNLVLGIETIDAISFYELLFRKIPVDEVEEVWFLDNLINKHKIYESLKQPLEIILALILALALLPLGVLIAILIKLTSRGPALFNQKRVGQYETIFTIYKFRTMVKNAEKEGAQWAQPKDKRVTFIGKILRHTHLDELPQLINIIKGDISFVGPRPERPEFTEKLKGVVPFYELRHLVRPGLTGWAQINYKYGASVEDALKKLQYDLYYLKNRSFWLDLSTVLKTIKHVAANN